MSVLYVFFFFSGMSLGLVYGVVSLLVVRSLAARGAAGEGHEPA